MRLSECYAASCLRPNEKGAPNHGRSSKPRQGLVSNSTGRRSLSGALAQVLLRYFKGPKVQVAGIGGSSYLCLAPLPTKREGPRPAVYGGRSFGRDLTGRGHGILPLNGHGRKQRGGRGSDSSNGAHRCPPAWHANSGGGDDRTPVELFRHGAASIEAHIRRLIVAFIPGTPPQN